MGILLFNHHCILGYLDGLVNIFSHIFNFSLKLVSRIGIWHQKVYMFLCFWCILPCYTERVNISASILMNILSGCFLSPKPSLMQDMILKKLIENTIGPWTVLVLGFPGSSAGKESACNAGDLGSIPELGRYPGEGLRYPLQCSWASVMALLVKN